MLSFITQLFIIHIMIGMVFVMFFSNISINLGTFVTASEYCEWVQAGIGV